MGYVISDGAAVLVDGLAGRFGGWLRDTAAARPDSIMQRYIDRSHRVLVKRLERLKSLERRLTAEEERELTFLLRSLIDLKNRQYGRE